MPSIREYAQLWDDAMCGHYGDHAQAAAEGLLAGVAEKSASFLGHDATTDHLHAQSFRDESHGAGRIALTAGTGAMLPGQLSLLGPVASGLYADHGLGAATALGSLGGMLAAQSAARGTFVPAAIARVLGAFAGAAATHAIGRRVERRGRE